MVKDEEEGITPATNDKEAELVAGAGASSSQTPDIKE